MQQPNVERKAYKRLLKKVLNITYTSSFNLQQAGFEPLGLREALNKIAHADPYKAVFFADEVIHELILFGNHGANPWIAIVSIADLCRAIKSLPDQSVQSV
ncbi:MAG: hypothetical protein VKJ64_15880 [Leptolyngbyaceae bacterium]|nr:hypothetical protein [Leptolyngbyaceae bacterium]